MMDHKNDDGKSKRLYLWRLQQSILRRISLNFSSNKYLNISQILSMIYKYQNCYSKINFKITIHFLVRIILYEYEFEYK